MYDNILNKPLQLKPNITNSARHVLEGLLQKDRTKRLGAKDDFVSNFFLFSWAIWGERSTSLPCLNFRPSKFMFLSQQMEIKNHVFFSVINWDDLINKKITPPFNPNVVSISLCLSLSFSLSPVQGGPKGISLSHQWWWWRSGNSSGNKLAAVIFLSHSFTYRKSRTFVPTKTFCPNKDSLYNLSTHL